MNELIEPSKNKFETQIEDLHFLLAKNKIAPVQVKLVPSTISLIVTKLLYDSHEGQMLARLKLKLGKTKEEIYQIVSEL